MFTLLGCISLKISDITLCCNTPPLAPPSNGRGTAWRGILGYSFHIVGQGESALHLHLSVNICKKIKKSETSIGKKHYIWELNHGILIILS